MNRRIEFYERATTVSKIIREPVEGVEIAPGLVVHKSRINPKFWSITHTASGAAVLRFTTRKTALAVGAAISPVFDWTSTEEDLKRQFLIEGKGGEFQRVKQEALQRLGV